MDEPLIVNAGDVWINFDRVSLIRAQRDAEDRLTGEMIIYFHATKAEGALVQGEDAEALQRFLKEREVKSADEAKVVYVESSRDESMPPLAGRVVGPIGSANDAGH